MRPGRDPVKKGSLRQKAVALIINGELCIYPTGN